MNVKTLLCITLLNTFVAPISAVAKDPQKQQELIQFKQQLIKDALTCIKDSDNEVLNVLKNPTNKLSWYLSKGSIIMPNLEYAVNSFIQTTQPQPTPTAGRAFIALVATTLADNSQSQESVWIAQCLNEALTQSAE